jgi:hypothetical protein
MKRVAQQSVSSRDDLDALLGAFYKAQLPTPWPACKAPARSRTLPLRPDSVRPWPVLASRLALAASVALLLLSFWLLPAGRRGDSVKLPTIGDPGARPGGLLAPGATPPRGQPGKRTPDKVKSSIQLEQGGTGGTNIKITVEELPSNK